MGARRELGMDAWVWRWKEEGAVAVAVGGGGLLCRSVVVEKEEEGP